MNIYIYTLYTHINKQDKLSRNNKITCQFWAALFGDALFWRTLTKVSLSVHFVSVDLHRWKLKKEEHIGWDSGSFCCLSSQPPFLIYPSFTQVAPTYLSMSPVHLYLTNPFPSMNHVHHILWISAMLFSHFSVSLSLIFIHLISPCPPWVLSQLLRIPVFDQRSEFHRASTAQTAYDCLVFSLMFDRNRGVASTCFSNRSTLRILRCRAVVIAPWLWPRPFDDLRRQMLIEKR